MKSVNLKEQGLLRIIAADLAQFRGLLLLVLLTLLTALAVVYLTHVNRELTAEREVLHQQRDDLDIEWRHLIIEQTALAEHNRIEQLAQSELDLQRPREQQEVLVPWQ